MSNFTSISNAGATLYHCPCGTPAASTSYQRLPSLYFCEECDSIRCRECVLEEVSAYYCPNCLFEVPTASVRAEKNRCARNCFLCPCCSNTLAVVPSDPKDPNVKDDPLNPLASTGEPPFYLSCLACKWDSRLVNIEFEKPTGLAAQTQRMEDSEPAVAEYDHIREHLEPWIKAGLAAETISARKAGHHSVSSHHHPSGAIAAAARALSHSNTTISRDIPSSIASASRFNSLHNLATMHKSSSIRSGLGKSAGDMPIGTTVKDELVPYRAKTKARMNLEDLENERVRSIKMVDDIEKIAKSEQRWINSANQPSRADNVKPNRIPLHSKRTKRCPACRHIVVKPETKAASIRFKIRLVASNYLPQIDVFRRVPPSLGSRVSAVGAGSATPSTAVASASASASASRRGRASGVSATAGSLAVETLVRVGSTQDIAEPLRPGRNFSFQLTFTNPLYEPIEVIVEVLEPIVNEEEEGAVEVDAIDGPERAESSEQDGSSHHFQDISMASSVKTATGSIYNQHDRSSPMPWSVSIPSPSFGINAFAEAWEYEGEEDEDEDDGVSGESQASRRRRYGPGILAKKGNKTAIQLDLTVGRDASGEVRVPLYVTYTYTAEDSIVGGNGTSKSKAKDGEQTSTSGDVKKQGDKIAEEKGNSMTGVTESEDSPLRPTTNLKSFSFWTSVPLGRVVPRTVGTVGGVGTDREARRMASTSALR